MSFQKNTSGQKWLIFAFDRTTNAPKTGDAANITAKIRKDYTSAVATNDTNPDELEDGYYEFTLTQTETNATIIDLLPESTTANIQVIGVPGRSFVVPTNFPTLGIASDGDLTKVNTLDGHTAQTGDTYALANGSSGFVATKADTAAILVDTGTTLQGELDGIQADTEDIQARLPAALTADGNIKADTLRVGGTLQTSGDIPALVTTVDTVVDAIKTKTDQFVFTIANQVDANALSGGGGLDAAGVRAAVGLAAANLDTQLGDIPTVAEFEARTIIAANYFDPATDAVANVTTTGTVTGGVTVTTNNDKTGYALTQSFPANFADLAITVTTGQVSLLTATQASIDAIEADTNELQTDNVPGLIAALNNIAATDIVSAGPITTLSGAVVNVDLVDTLTTYTGNTPQTANVATLITTVGVAGVGLTDLGGMSTGMKAQVNTEADAALTDYDAPTNTEMLAAFVTTDALITTVDGVVDGIQVDLSNGTDGLGALKTAIQAVVTTAMTESYAADGVAPTPAQALMLILQRLTEFVIVGDTITVKKLDGTTAAATLTMDSDTAPTSSTRAT